MSSDAVAAAGLPQLTRAEKVCTLLGAMLGMLLAIALLGLLIVSFLPELPLRRTLGPPPLAA